ncbi:hypothetical protein BLS_004743 [Venturia inaequalis]|uniref:Uncharacterized protein n=1 Tax=Venturia inaequalis TaxID=5025 RepID=A0A8H3V766_VENIN|nr:hypothetical protein BLS_004743 [Venturia inaequalis]KAE9981903.1 hypothetical protein EG328_011359 [Venturia inaequalis]RDI81160.1 hypothetical protein Vi05172_g8792 [Venturia inaequalis]
MDREYKPMERASFDNESLATLPWSLTSFSRQLGYREPPKSCGPSSPRQTYFQWTKNITIYLFAFWGIITLLSQIRPLHFDKGQQKPANLSGCDCGDSTTEAESLGCKFDSLSMAWLPEQCRDDELTAEFNTKGGGPNGEWIYYADKLHTEEIDVAVVAAMGNDPSARVHMGKDWHMVHCVYYWRKQFRTRTNGKIVEPRSDTEDHIKHCGMVILEASYGTVSGVALNTNEAVDE